jgi:aspartate aminotransferase-like enzyme
VLTGRTWVPTEAASALVTGAALPAGLDAAVVLAAAPAGHALSAGIGPGGDRLVRLVHTGPRARLDVVLGDLSALGHALRKLGVPADVGAALAAAEGAARDA